MTEFFKNNPIALRHFLLYDFLHRKSVDSVTDFSATVLRGVCSREEIYSRFWQFDRGIIEDGAEPVADMREILRNDKKALRVCVMYEWLSPSKMNLTRMMGKLCRKSEPLPVFIKYEHFCKVIGDDAMEYREFDFWFYRFVNGEFDLNYERDEDKKILELMDMPIDIMKNLVEYLDIFDRLSLAKSSRALRTFTEDQKLFHPELMLRFEDYEDYISLGRNASIGYTKHARYTTEYETVCMKKASIKLGSIATFKRNVSPWKQAILDFKSILKNPKFHLETLEINCFSETLLFEHESPPSEYDEIVHELETVLKFNHQLHVKKLQIQSFTLQPLIILLPLLTPGYLKTIDIYLRRPSNVDVMEKVVELEQWKQAKHCGLKGHQYICPLHHFYHFKKLCVCLKEFSMEDIRQIKKIAFNSPDFENWLILSRKIVSMDSIRHEFGDAIQRRSNTYHYQIPNSSEYFEIQLGPSSIEIRRKKI